MYDNDERNRQMRNLNDNLYDINRSINKMNNGGGYYNK